MKINELIEQIEYDLMLRYYDYYWTVSQTFLDEAVENTIYDLDIKWGTVPSIEKIHKHISENYI